MRKILMIYLWGQVIFSVCVILFGAGYAIRCLVETLRSTDGRPGYIFVWLFSIMAYVGWRLMFRASIEELREERKRGCK